MRRAAGVRRELSAAQQQVAHGPIAALPAWHVAPYLSIWAVESEKPGKIGWWVICGDVPADHVPAKFVKDAARRPPHLCGPLEAAAGRDAPRFAAPRTQPRPAHQWPELAKLLAARAELLAQFRRRRVPLAGMTPV